MIRMFSDHRLGVTLPRAPKIVENVVEKNTR